MRYLNKNFFNFLFSFLAVVLVITALIIVFIIFNDDINEFQERVWGNKPMPEKENIFNTENNQ